MDIEELKIVDKIVQKGNEMAVSAFFTGLGVGIAIVVIIWLILGGK